MVYQHGFICMISLETGMLKLLQGVGNLPKAQMTFCCV